MPQRTHKLCARISGQEYAALEQLRGESGARNLSGVVRALLRTYAGEISDQRVTSARQRRPKIFMLEASEAEYENYKALADRLDCGGVSELIRRCIVSVDEQLERQRKSEAAFCGDDGVVVRLSEGVRLIPNSRTRRCMLRLSEAEYRNCRELARRLDCGGISELMRRCVAMVSDPSVEQSGLGTPFRRKDRTIVVRVSEKEHRLYEILANEAHLGLSDWIRKAIGRRNPAALATWSPESPRSTNEELRRRPKEPSPERTRYSRERIMGAVKHMETGRKVSELAPELGVSEATLYAWKRKYRAPEVNEIDRSKTRTTG